MKYIAHTKDGQPVTTAADEKTCQSLKDHLTQTAQRMKAAASVFAAGDAGYMIGLVHDIGKYDGDFQAKIRGEQIAAPHAMAGACLIHERYDPLSRYYGIIVGSHHTGLPNLGNSQSRTSETYYGRLHSYVKKPLPFEEDGLVLPETIQTPLRPETFNWQKDNRIKAFQFATHIRMLFSALVDADFTNTEEFCKGIERKTAYPSIESLWETFSKGLPQNDGSEINQLRAEVLQSCIAAGKKQRGLFTLTVPTGGGKTLSSLAFALRHAKEHGLKRVIYVIPYISIIEQNAKVIKEMLGAENVLEHHASMTQEAEKAGKTADGSEMDSSKRSLEWAAENWDIPVIVTTNVQFFESLFSNQKSKLRKIHHIANSVVIFDEAQKIPLAYLSPCMAIISELIANYKVSAVLCTATQPLVDKYVYETLKPFEIVENPARLAEQLKRVHYQYVGKKTDEEILAEIKAASSALVIVNSRRHAFALYKMLEQTMQKESLFYLSTLLTPLHRSEKIKEIKERLKKQLPVTVISTQLVEAGVDLDFPVVFRSMAGIDSILQAGGRANREGKLLDEDGSPRLAIVVIWDPDSDQGGIPRLLRNTAELGREVMSCLGDEAFGLSGIRMYFDLLYQLIERDNIMDQKGILDAFEMFRGEMIKMEFEAAARQFKLIDEHTQSIVAGGGSAEAERLIGLLRKNDYTKETLRQLQKYSISVYSNEIARLYQEKALENIGGVNVLIAPAYYSKEGGLDIFTGANMNAEAYLL